uniref:ATP-dependent DNA helicase n=1 Tax=Biomphalaria glabrata TaxID=6526 RepID=A0A2C9LRQ8_BIOGL
MRVDEEETDFAEFLLRIGDGEVPLNDMGEIALPQDVISKTNIIDKVYGDCFDDKSYENLKDRAILAPLNKDVNLINCELIDRLPGEEKVYFSFDSKKILTGEHFGKAVHIPRITLDSSKGKLGCTMQRHQFPVTPAFAMTVHKSQGQTFQFVGVDLSVPVFMH